MSKDIQKAHTDVIDKVVEGIQNAISHVPASSEPLAADPLHRSSVIITTASLKAAAVSGTLALPPGPAGLVTILPDLVAIWALQTQLVADIAAAYGKKGALGPEQMLYCLFRHAASQAVRDLVVRVGERVLVRRVTLKFFQTVLRKVGVKVTQRLIGKVIVRWIPFVGAAGVAAYAFYDTHQVGKTAVELFSKDIVVEPPVDEANASPA
jgi:hypothetical protein